MQRLVLVGGGHAHLFVLEQLARQKRAINATLVSPSRWLDYSGMLPGWIAGDYREEQCRIDLRALCQRAKVRFIEASVVGIDAEQCSISLQGEEQGEEHSEGELQSQHSALPTHQSPQLHSLLHYELLSLDIGSETNVEPLLALHDKLIAIRPLANFRSAWLKILQTSANQPKLQLAVVGGGAAGVELALAINSALRQVQGKTQSQSKAQLSLIAGEQGLLQEHAPAVQTKALQLLTLAGINVINARAVGTQAGLQLSNGQLLAADHVIAASGSSPAPWLKQTTLALDPHGYVQVNAQHQSVSHPNVFAAGSVCSRIDLVLPRSGVQAVRAGPILAHNLLAKLHPQTLRRYQPKATSLYLLACGNQTALASWGRWSAHGRWVWRLKDWIDRRFIKRFTVVNSGE